MSSTGPKTIFQPVRIAQLSSAEHPLLNKFYRQHRSPMRANRTAQLWVARRVEIVGGLCLNSLDGGFWLTALLVDPLQRRQAIASHLIRQVLASTVQPVWLFCHPELVPFYERLGFATTRSLPTALSDRLARYGRSKPLLAMVCPPKALASAVLGR